MLTPDINLLDLKMPRMDGRDVLIERARDPSLGHLPVVILTTSEDPQEILRMYRLRCNSYIVKPLEFEDRTWFVQSFGDYWLNVVALPSTD